MKDLIENFDKLTPNAKLTALEKQQHLIEEEIKTLKEQYTECDDCGFLFDKNAVEGTSEKYIRRECTYTSPDPFGDNEYADAEYVDTFCFCPNCGKKHLKEHYFINFKR